MMVYDQLSQPHAPDPEQRECKSRVDRFGSDRLHLAYELTCLSLPTELSCVFRHPLSRIASGEKCSR